MEHTHNKQYILKELMGLKKSIHGPRVPRVGPHW